MNNTQTQTPGTVTIRQVGCRWMVIVADQPQAGYPTVPCYHTAGVYYAPLEALELKSILDASSKEKGWKD